MTSLVRQFSVSEEGKKSNNSSVHKFKETKGGEELWLCFVESSLCISCLRCPCAVARDGGKYFLINLGFNLGHVEN